MGSPLFHTHSQPPLLCQPPLTTLLQIRYHIWQRLLTDLEQCWHVHDSLTWFLTISTSISWLNLTVVCLLKPPCTHKCVACVHLDVWASLCRGCFHIHTLGKFLRAHFESQFRTCRYVCATTGSQVRRRNLQSPVHTHWWWTAQWGWRQFVLRG